MINPFVAFFRETFRHGQRLRFVRQVATYRFLPDNRKRNLWSQKRQAAALWPVTLLMLVVVGGCSSSGNRTYVDPKGSDAQHCLQVCQGERFACRTPIQRQDEDCQYRYRIAYSQFQRCLQIRGNRGGCQKPRGCSVPNYLACGVSYDQCFLGCGGQILSDEENYRVD